MLSVINLMIVFFTLLIIYQIFLANFSIVEGLTSQQNQSLQLEQQANQQNSNNCDSNNEVLTPEEQNAGNISQLQKEVEDISGNVAALQEQVNSMMQAQQEYAQKMTPSTPPQITGTGADSNTQENTTDSTSNTETIS